MSGGRLVADEQGIWRHDDGLPPMGRTWEQLASIVAHKIHAPDGIVLVLDIEDTDGASLVITDALPGFAEMIAAMPMYLPGLEPGFLAEMDEDSPMSDPRQLWSLV